MHEFLPYAWFEGRCIPFKEAKISIATHALHYGTAAFGGMRAIPNPTNKEEFLLFRTDKHIKRLSQSAKLLLTDISEEYIFKALEEVIKKNNDKKENSNFIFDFLRGLNYENKNKVSELLNPINFFIWLVVSFKDIF